jgi:hypothetical protein
MDGSPERESKVFEHAHLNNVILGKDERLLFSGYSQIYHMYFSD